MKKTYLLFTVSVGLAHIVRTLALAEELKARGHKVKVALPKRKHKSFAKSTVDFVDVHPYTTKDSMAEIQRVLMSGRFEKHFQSEFNLIDTIKPDVIINDFRYSSMFSALSSTPFFKNGF